MWCFPFSASLMMCCGTPDNEVYTKTLASWAVLGDTETGPSARTGEDKIDGEKDFGCR